MGFATRVWYAAGRTAVWAHPEPCVRGLAEWGGDTTREHHHWYSHRAPSAGSASVRRSSIGSMNVARGIAGADR
jgi:hypothetical protein